MKSILAFVFLSTAAISGSIAQSQSFQALEDKFSSCDNVPSFKTSGFFARIVLCLAGEHEFKRAIREIKQIQLLTIPKSAFHERALSLQGFKRVLRKDSFEELASVREHGEEVVVFKQPLKNSALNQYLILIDNPEEVVAVEIKGYIDPDLFMDKNEPFYHKL